MPFLFCYAGASHVVIMSNGYFDSPYTRKFGSMKAAQFAVLLILLALPSARSEAESPIAVADEPFRTFLTTHCQECHSGKKPKGDFGLDKLSEDFGNAANRERWLAVQKRVQSGEMPPKEKPRPPQKDVQALVGWIDAKSGADRLLHGRTVLRRLNRFEYQNTVRDLLGIDVDFQEMLPADSSANGFDNNGEALHVSSFLMDKYLEAADIALGLAIANGPQPAAIKKRYSLKDQHHVKTIDREGLPNSRRHRDAVQFVGVERGPHLPVLPAGPRPISLPDLRLRDSEFRQAGHVLRLGGRQADGREERPDRLLRRPCREAGRRRVCRVHGASDYHSHSPLRAGRSPDR